MDLTLGELRLGEDDHKDECNNGDDKDNEFLFKRLDDDDERFLRNFKN